MLNITINKKISNIIMILILIITIIIYLMIYNKNKKYIKYDKKNKINKINKLDKICKYFYDSQDISEDLNLIEPIKEQIYKETYNIFIDNSKEWKDWPEKYLYAIGENESDINNHKWKIYPFYAFGIWVNKNCISCPTIYNYLKSIKGLKLATLSRLTPGMKLNPHKGWGFHSNHVIRCHLPLIIPKENESCFISVYNLEETIEYKKYHKQYEWLIFDDSLLHYAENNGSTDRIVLIIDIERPKNIPIGQSTDGDTKELNEIIEYFKKNN